MRLLFSVALCLTMISASDRAQKPNDAADGDPLPVESGVPFVLTKINEQIIDEFRRAWKQSGFGAALTEAVVLLFRLSDGTLKGVLAGPSEQRYKFSFVWSPAIIAIVHSTRVTVIPGPGKKMS